MIIMIMILLQKKKKKFVKNIRIEKVIYLFIYLSMYIFLGAFFFYKISLPTLSLIIMLAMIMFISFFFLFYSLLALCVMLLMLKLATHRTQILLERIICIRDAKKIFYGINFIFSSSFFFVSFRILCLFRRNKQFSRSL